MTCSKLHGPVHTLVQISVFKSRDRNLVLTTQGLTTVTLKTPNTHVSILEIDCNKWYICCSVVVVITFTPVM